MSIVYVETTLRGNLDAFDVLVKMVKFDCGPDGVIVIDARSGAATLSRDDVDDADCVLELTSEDLQLILDKELDPTGAFMSGRLRVKGDMGLAMQLATVLG